MEATPSRNMKASFSSKSNLLASFETISVIDRVSVVARRRAAAAFRSLMRSVLPALLNVPTSCWRYPAGSPNDGGCPMVEAKSSMARGAALTWSRTSESVSRISWLQFRLHGVVGFCAWLAFV